MSRGGRPAKSSGLYCGMAVADAGPFQGAAGITGSAPVGRGGAGTVGCVIGMLAAICGSAGGGDKGTATCGGDTTTVVRGSAGASTKGDEPCCDGTGPSGGDGVVNLGGAAFCFGGGGPNGAGGVKTLRGAAFCCSG